ncbi:MAG: branched-chain amino acid ABC transporter permease [Candidatus Caldarchaeum sp.]|nr:branched-chain amino acid ABC transporter permease [Candidatus Caldarchaeum sp.]
MMVFTPEVLFGQLLVGALLLGGVYALVTMGLALIFGVMRILNIAHGEFIILGAYATYWISKSLGLDPFLSIALSIPVSALLGFTVNTLVIKGLTKSFDAPIVSSFGLLLVMQASMLIAWSGDPRSLVTPFTAESIAVGPVLIPVIRLIAFTLSVTVLISLYVFLTRTFVGRAIRAVSQDSETAATLGIPVQRLQTFTFVLSACLAGLSGGLIAMLMSFQPTFGPEFLLKSFVVLALSGVGNIPGVIAGGLILGVGESYGSFFLGSGFRNVVAYALLIGLLLVRPRGLFGERKVREV